MQALMNMLFPQGAQAPGQTDPQGIAAPAQQVAMTNGAAQQPPVGLPQPMPGQAGNLLPGQSDGSSPGTEKVVESLLAGLNPAAYKLARQGAQPAGGVPQPAARPYGSM